MRFKKVPGVCQGRMTSKLMEFLKFSATTSDTFVHLKAQNFKHFYLRFL